MKSNEDRHEVARALPIIQFDPPNDSIGWVYKLFIKSFEKKRTNLSLPDRSGDAEGYQEENREDRWI